MPDTHLNACLELSSENLNKFNPQQPPLKRLNRGNKGKGGKDHLASYCKVRNMK